MDKTLFTLKKWFARALVGIGAVWGIASCSRPQSTPNPAEAVYGPPPGYENKRIEVVEDVYGPPVEEIDSAVVDEHAEEPVVPKKH